jgi:hypothetical protein
MAMTAWAFLPSTAMMESEEFKAVEKKHIEAINNATTPGLKKQLELQLEWLRSPNESLGE